MISVPGLSKAGQAGNPGAFGLPLVLKCVQKVEIVSARLSRSVNEQEAQPHPSNLAETGTLPDSGQ